MPSTLTTTLCFTIHFIFISTFSITSNATFSEQFVKTNANNEATKISHLHFYFHDIVSGKHPTAVTIAGPKNAFGTTVMIDDPLTEGPEPHSKIIGRAQGMYAEASQHDAGLLVVMNLAFLEGKFNGTSLSILGRNLVTEEVREMPVVGGSGLFRLARGYALAKTIRYNPKTGDAVVEYNVLVRHG